ncbi:MAG: class I SAM-dependent methyltransferase [Gemmataceae bacterium]
METHTAVNMDPNHETFDHYANTYSTEVEKAFGGLAKEHAFFFRHKAFLIAGALKQYWRGPHGSARLLDCGCGIGTLHPHLNGIVAEVEGFDVSEESIAAARRTMPAAKYTVCEPGVFPCPDAAYDCVTAMGVLHHVPVESRKLFYSELRRVVKPEGIVLIIEHNPFNPATQWVVNRCPIDNDAVLLRSSETSAGLRQAGFAKTVTEFILFTPFENNVFRWVDRLLWWLPFGAQYMTVGVPRLSSR